MTVASSGLAPGALGADVRDPKPRTTGRSSVCSSSRNTGSWSSMRAGMLYTLVKLKRWYRV